MCESVGERRIKKDEKERRSFVVSKWKKQLSDIEIFAGPLITAVDQKATVAHKIQQIVNNQRVVKIQLPLSPLLCPLER